MQPVAKKLGEMLLEAGLITAAQLQDTLRHQRAAGGRMGSNLVAMGIISDDSLMDFLAQQTGVPRLDVKGLDVPAAVLERIPRRLAEQLAILPVAFKEPKSLVLAMADPSDLNAVDSARFASGMNIEPMVASHTALKAAIAELYRNLEAGPPAMPLEVTLKAAPESLPLLMAPQTMAPREFAKDPFFGGEDAAEVVPSPFSFFPEPVRTLDPLVPTRQPEIIHARSAASTVVRSLDTFGTRALVLGVIKLMQRRGILGEDELQRFLTNLVDSGDVDPGR